MIRRALFIPLGVLGLGLALLSVDQKTVAQPPKPPAAVKSDYLLFAHLDAKQIRESEAFAEIKKEFAKAGADEWDQIDKSTNSEIGVKLTDIDAVTVCVPELSERGEPNFVFILAANKAVPKIGLFGLKEGAKPDAQGFYPLSPGVVAHFPDDKTLVVLSKEVAQKYLGGYAKNRTGWPLTADLAKAASGHTMFANAQLDKIPGEFKNAGELKDFAPLLATKSLTLTGDLKGKEFALAARGTFADAASADKAKGKGQDLVKFATGEVEKFLRSKNADELGALLPAVKELDRSLKAVKLEVSGSDLTLVADYKAAFDFGAMAAQAVLKVREAAARIKVSNNFKQVGLALHSYHDVNNQFPVYGLGAKGAPLAKATDKPLLSWRVALLPYIEQEALYKQFKLDEPWDSENNKKLIEKMPPLFAPVSKKVKPGQTLVQMVIGPKAMQPGNVKVTSITDGLSNTIAVVDAAEPVIWTKPDDVMLTEKELPKDLKKRFGGQFKNGFIALFWDGSVRFISESISDKTLGALLSPAGGEVLGDDF